MPVAKRLSLAAAGLAVVAVAVPATGAVAAGGLAKATIPTVAVADDFYSPASLKVKKGTKVRFKWDKSNTNSHNVFIVSGPNGIKKKDFKSATGSIGVKFNATFDKRGVYDFKCTLHPDVMKLTVRVGK